MRAKTGLAAALVLFLHDAGRPNFRRSSGGVYRASSPLPAPAAPPPAQAGTRARVRRAGSSSRRWWSAAPRCRSPASRGRSTPRSPATPEFGRKAIVWALDPRRRPAPAGARLRLVPGPADRGAAPRPYGAPRQGHRGHRRCGDPGRTLPHPRRHRPLRPRAPGAAARARRDRAPVVGAPDGRRAASAGKSLVARDDAYALWEFLHAVRDNTNLDLRENVPHFFKDFPIEHLLSHYPATYPMRRKTNTVSASRRRPANRTCRPRPYPARSNWRWWRST